MNQKLKLWWINKQQLLTLARKQKFGHFLCNSRVYVCVQVIWKLGGLDLVLVSEWPVKAASSLRQSPCGSNVSSWVPRKAFLSAKSLDLWAQLIWSIEDVCSKSISHSVVSDSCNPMDCSPPGSSVHGIFQARILERVAIHFSRGFSQLKDGTQVSCIAGRFFTVWAIRENKMQSPKFDLVD